MKVDDDAKRKRGETPVEYNWPQINSKYEIPYVIDSSITSFCCGLADRLTEQIKLFNEFFDNDCGPKWRPKLDSETIPFVKFVRGEGCSSYVGYSPGLAQDGQEITLAPECILGLPDGGTTHHEMLHALGYEHEQSRVDRDTYVQIKFENILAGYESNFDKSPSNYESLQSKTQYDYHSVMHYSQDAFSKNGQDTIVPLQALTKPLGGDELTATDILQVNRRYCPGYPVWNVVSKTECSSCPGQYTVNEECVESCSDELTRTRTLVIP